MDKSERTEETQAVKAGIHITSITSKQTDNGQWMYYRHPEKWSLNISDG